MITPRHLAALGAALVTSLLHATEAAPPAPADFAWSLPLVIGEGRPLQRLAVPPAVYAGAVRPDLGDVRVFNGAGEAVPHLLLAPTDPEATMQWTTAPLFSLPSATSNGDLAVQVRTDARGAVVQVEQRGQSKGSAAASVGSAPARAWLVDLSQHPEPISRLRLHWSQSAAPFATTVKVATSASLDRWRPLTQATVAELTHGDQRLRRNEFALRDNEAYLRLEWTDPGATVALERVEVARSEAVEQAWQWHTLAPTSVTADGVVYASGGQWPVARLQLALPAANQLTAVDIASAADMEGPWQTVGQHTFHRLQFNGEELRNEPVALAPRAAPLWRLQGAPAELREVRLELGWRPHQLLFLSQGEGPYTLAYGSGRVGRAGGSLPALLQSSADSEPLIAAAIAGEPSELSGSAALAIPTQPLPWRQLGLWAILVVGVGLLGWMAWRLLDEMRQRPVQDE